MVLDLNSVCIIGVTGGSGSGKTTIVNKITEMCNNFVCISQDSYYKSAGFVNNSNITAYNFDRPDSFDTELMCQHIEALKSGQAVDVPVYDFIKHIRTNETVHVESAPLIIIDGLMILYDKRLRSLFDLKIYVDTPADVRFIRRLERDIKERGRTTESVIKQYIEVVRPGHNEFIEPTKQYADIIIPEGGYNENALKVLCSYVKEITACQK